MFVIDLSLAPESVWQVSEITQWHYKCH